MDGSIEVKKEDKKPFIKVEFKVEAKTEQEALGCSLKKEEELEEKKAVSKILIECPRTVSVQLPANSESDRWQDSVPFVEMEVDVQLPVKKEEGERKPITTSLNRIPELYPEVDRDSNRISVAPPSRQVSPEIDLPMLDQMPIEAPVMDVEMQSTSDPSEEEARPARAGSEPVIIQQRSALPPHLIHKPKAEFQGIDLWPELRLKHTEGIPRVDLPDGAEEGVKKTLKRIFFAETYGGSFVETIPTISEKRLRHHNHPHWLFMTDDLHPFGPAAPGEPGIWFSIAQSPLAPDEDDDEPILVLDDSDDGEEKLNDKETVIYHTFRGLSGKESGEWLYLGEYTRTRLPNMFLSEYQTLHPNVRRCWGEGIRKGEWGRDVRIAVHHRKTNEGRNPTRAQYDVLADANETYQHHVSAEEIAQAYWNGEETMTMYLLTPKGYNLDFRHEMFEKFGPWKIMDAKKRLKRKLEREAEKEAERLAAEKAKKKGSAKLKALKATSKAKPNGKSAPNGRAGLVSSSSKHPPAAKRKRGMDSDDYEDEEDESEVDNDTSGDWGARRSSPKKGRA